MASLARVEEGHGEMGLSSQAMRNGENTFNEKVPFFPYLMLVFMFQTEIETLVTNFFQIVPMKASKTFIDYSFKHCGPIIWNSITIKLKCKINESDVPFKITSSNIPKHDTMF